MRRILRVLAVAAALAPGAQALPLTVEWERLTRNEDGSPIGEDISAYRIYYADVSFLRGPSYLSVVQAKLDSEVKSVDVAPDRTSHVLDLPAGTTYYLRITAVDRAGQESDFNLGDGSADAEVRAFLFGSAPGLKEAYAYPNPAVDRDPVIRVMMGSVESVEITIFDQAGRVAHTVKVSESVMVGGEPAHEYRWTGDKAPGIYHAVIHGKNGGETIRARASFAVVR
jgi:hypothetical protein